MTCDIPSFEFIIYPNTYTHDGSHNNMIEYISIKYNRVLLLKLHQLESENEFSNNFRNKLLESEQQFKCLVIYIHRDVS